MPGLARLSLDGAERVWTVLAGLAGVAITAAVTYLLGRRATQAQVAAHSGTVATSEAKDLWDVVRSELTRVTAELLAARAEIAAMRLELRALSDELAASRLREQTAARKAGP